MNLKYLAFLEVTEKNLCKEHRFSKVPHTEIYRCVLCGITKEDAEDLALLLEEEE